MCACVRAVVALLHWIEDRMVRSGLTPIPVGIYFDESRVSCSLPLLHSSITGSPSPASNDCQNEHSRKKAKRIFKS